MEGAINFGAEFKNDTDDEDTDDCAIVIDCYMLEYSSANVPGMEAFVVVVALLFGVFSINV